MYENEVSDLLTRFAFVCLARAPSMHVFIDRHHVIPEKGDNHIILIYNKGSVCLWLTFFGTLANS